MSTLKNQIVISERDDVARGVRALLAQPLITERADPATFDVLRRRKDALVRWFDYYCGWSLTVEPRSGYARLVKVRPDTDGSRPARRLRSGRAPFDRRRYTLLCVVAAELVSSPATTIGMLADRLVQATAADPVVPSFDTAMRSERMAYVDVLRLLESYGVLEVVDGHTESFVDSAEAKVLYRVDATLLVRLLAAPVGPSRLEVPAEDVPGRFDEVVGMLSVEQRYGPRSDQASETQRNLWLRHSVLRRLFDEPVVHWEDLTEAQRAYVTSPTGRQIMRKAAEQGGFVLEERAEGVLLVDTDAIATDDKFPDDSSTAKVAALALLDAIGPSGATPEQLAAEAEGFLARFPQRAKSYRSEDGLTRLVSDALAVLVRFGLVRHEQSRVVALPAAARYRVVNTDGARGGEA